MSGAGAGPGADLPSPAKLRRLDERSGTGPAAVVPPRREISHPPHPGEGRGARARGGGGGSGHARGGGARAPPGGRMESAGEGPETPEAGMETPKEGVETPKEGMETPKEGLETPKEGMETPMKGVEIPKEGMETQMKGLETPVKGLETPKEGMETPVKGLEISKEGMETPKEGMETPVRGMETPKDGMETPVRGMETPMKGLETPVKGLETPKEGMETLVKSMETPGDEKKTPKDEMETPKDGLETLETGVETPVRGLKTPKKGLKATMEQREALEATITPCLEQENGGLETTRGAVGSLETPSGCKESLETTVSHCLERENGGLETPLESRGSPETTREVPGTTNGRRGSLETAVSRCLEQGRRSQGGSETTSEARGGLESDVPPTSRGLKTTSRRKAGLKTPGRAKGSVEAVGTHCLDWERGRNGGLETPREGLETPKEGLETTRETLAGLETTMRPKGSPETTVISHVEWDREQEEGLETDTEPTRAVLEPTPTACVELPEPVEVPAPPPKCPEAEESAVISVGEEEEEEEEDGEEEGPGRYLAALEAVQLQLEAVEEEAARAFRRLRARFGLRRRPHLQRRNRLIQHIPGFWVTAFLNHPQLSAMISDRDEDALSYMTSLQVEEFGQSRPGCRIRFFFSVNPYFQNDVVAKEFVRGPSGHLVSHSTPIRWWQGQDPRSRPHKGPPGPRSFFAWFGDHSFPAGDRVAEIIKEELWPNPLQFYLLGEGAEGPPDSESGEDCVLIEDDDEDVQEIPDDGDGSGVEEVLAEEPPERRTDPPGGRI